MTGTGGDVSGTSFVIAHTPKSAEANGIVFHKLVAVIDGTAPEVSKIELGSVATAPTRVAWVGELERVNMLSGATPKGPAVTLAVPLLPLIVLVNKVGDCNAVGSMAIVETCSVGPPVAVKGVERVRFSLMNAKCGHPLKLPFFMGFPLRFVRSVDSRRVRVAYERRHECL